MPLIELGHSHGTPKVCVARTSGSSPSRARVVVVAVSSALLFAIAAAAFWYEDLRYARPTPRPEALVEPPMGTEIRVADWLTEAGVDAGRRPVLVHFFNPDCPCSRFNLDHLRKLHARFGERVAFVAAVQADAMDGLEAKLTALGLGIPYFIDTGGRRAAEVGVYSTPQAVVLDASSRIVFRGNYNLSRYCTDPRTEFVRIALEEQVGEGEAQSSREVPAYGCELPSRTERMRD